MRPRLEVLEDRCLLSASITDLGTLSGYVSSFPSAINAKGQVVGYLDNGFDVQHAFLYSNGTMTDLGALNSGDSSSANAINSGGQVAGASGSDGDHEAFLYSNGKIKGLGTLDGTFWSIADGIDAAGDVVGNTGDTSTPFLYRNGKMSDLNTILPTGSPWRIDNVVAITDGGEILAEATNNGNPDSVLLNLDGSITPLGLGATTQHQLNAISSSGDVAGVDYTTPLSGGGYQAFLYSSGQKIDLGTLPGFGESAANGVNGSGMVVGSCTLGGPTGQTVAAFLYADGQMIDLNSLLPSNSGWDLTDATAINDSGQIVGQGTFNGTVGQAFLLDLGASPTIIGNPSNQTLAVGQSAEFTASALGSTTTTVKWQLSTDNGKTFSDIGGATKNTLTLNKVTADMNGNEYRAIFTNSGGTATTSAATLSITAPPAITGNPSNLTVIAGHSATFTGSASGAPTPSVQWQISTDDGKSFSDISGAINATLNLNNVTSDMNSDEYRAVFKNSAGSATTSAATLTVTAPPVITGNPSSLTVTAGHSATFTASASANPAATVQWQVSTDGGMTFTNISGATSTTLTLNNVTTAMNGREYQAVFTNSVGSVMSTAATLTVTASSPSPSPSPSSSSPSSPSPPAPPPINTPPLLAFLDSLFGAGTETVNADGSASITNSLFGIPFLVSMFNSSGKLESVTILGIDITFLFG